MKKAIVYRQRSSHERLSSIRSLSEKLLDTLEEGDYEPLDEQSVEALIMLLRTLSHAIQAYEEESREAVSQGDVSSRFSNSHPKPE